MISNQFVQLSLFTSEMLEYIKMPDLYIGVWRAVMESRPHHPRPRPRRDRDLAIRDRDHPFRDRDHARPRPRPNIFLVVYFSTQKTSFFHGEYFYTKNIIFFTGDIGIYRQQSAFFFGSCGLNRVVSSETETFEPRDRDLWEMRPRRDRHP